MYVNIDSHIFGDICFFYCTKTIASKSVLDSLPNELRKRDAILLKDIFHLHISLL